MRPQATPRAKPIDVTMSDLSSLIILQLPRGRNYGRSVKPATKAGKTIPNLFLFQRAGIRGGVMRISHKTLLQLEWLVFRSKGSATIKGFCT